MKTLLLILSLVVGMEAQAQINIWEGTSCSKKVKMTPFLAEGKNNVAVVVCPGGSYFWHDTQAEGDLVAQWLQRNGISAFVLNYRTAYVPAFIFHFRYIFRGNRYPDPQNDLKQALRIIRERAEEFGVDPQKVGVWGFLPEGIS